MWWGTREESSSKGGSDGSGGVGEPLREVIESEWWGRKRFHEWGSLNSDDGLWELLEGRFLNLDAELGGCCERGSLIPRKQGVLSAGSDWLLPAAAELTLGSHTRVISFLDENSMWEGVVKRASCIEGNTERMNGKGFKQESTCIRDPLSEFKRLTTVSLPSGFRTHQHTLMYIQETRKEQETNKQKHWDFF